MKSDEPRGVSKPIRSRTDWIRDQDRNEGRSLGVVREAISTQRAFPGDDARRQKHSGTEGDAQRPCPYRLHMSEEEKGKGPGRLARGYASGGGQGDQLPGRNRLFG
jgi:hypothetical protein